MAASETHLVGPSSLPWGCSFHASSSLLRATSCWRNWFRTRFSPPLLRICAAANRFLTSVQLLSDFFDGLCGAVIGVIGVIAAQILKSSVEGSPRKEEAGSINITTDRISQSAPAALLYVLALAALYKFANKYTPLLLLATGAIAGQFLFVNWEGES